MSADRQNPDSIAATHLAEKRPLLSLSLIVLRACYDAPS
jgi:hypothetical protein